MSLSDAVTTNSAIVGLTYTPCEDASVSLVVGLVRKTIPGQLQGIGTNSVDSNQGRTRSEAGRDKSRMEPDIRLHCKPTCVV
jgi:hypothetical protein